MATRDREDILPHLRALDEQLARVAPRRDLEARLRARLRVETGESGEAAPGRHGLRDGLWGMRLPIAAALVAAAVIALGVGDGGERFAERPAVVTSPEAPAAPIASESPAHEASPQDPRPARPSEHVAPAPIAPAPAPRPSAAPAEASPLAQDAAPDEAAPAAPARPEVSPIRSEQLQKIGERAARAPGEAPSAMGPSGYRVAPSSTAAAPPGPGVRGPGGAARTSDGEPAGEESAAPPPPEAVDAECTSAEALKDEALAACEAKGLALAEVDLLDACGDGKFERVEYQCAEEAPAACFDGSVGDGVTCQDPGLLKQQAGEACENAGLQLVDFIYSDDGCGWQTLKAAYTCCPAGPPDPGPGPGQPDCVVSTVGAGATCRGLDVLKAEAVAVCEQSGRVLGDIYPAGGCPDGQASKAEISCCSTAGAEP